MPNVLKHHSSAGRGHSLSRSLGEKLVAHAAGSGGSLNTSALSRLLGVLRTLRDATGNPELQMQTMNTFLYIASRHPNEIAQGEIERILGLQQTTVSRNCAYLAKGNAAGHGGYKLVDVFEDVDYRKRKLAKLTPKGLEVAKAIADQMGY